MKSMNRQRGFSMIELLVVVGIILIISATAMYQIGPALAEAKKEEAFAIAMQQMRIAHERAIDERRIYRLSLVAPSTFNLDLVNVDPVTRVQTFVFLNTMDLPQGYQFVVVPGIPTAPAQTPDNFGIGAVAIDLSVNNGGGGLTQLFFMPDGRALDNVGRLNNGVFYIAKPGVLMTSRAVSIFGAAGRIKGWRLFRQANGTVVWQ
jgi:prepilin-type N-terminal cleavage/methylation domain-containing protein